MVFDVKFHSLISLFDDNYNVVIICIYSFRFKFLIRYCNYVEFKINAKMGRHV